MTGAGNSEERYSVCIAYQTDSGDVYFYRVADYYPDEVDEGNELVPAVTASDVLDLYGEHENPDHVYCLEAYHDFSNRDSDVYLLEWRTDPYDRRKQLSRICDGHDGLPTTDDVREVIDIPDINCREDLVKALQTGYCLNGVPTREFYLVYERPAGNYQRFAIKCRRDDFVSRDGTLRLLDSVANIRQSVLTAPIVVLDEKKIISTDIPEIQEREIYSGLGELEEEEGRLLLRPLEYFAADYAKYYLAHCETDAKLTDKERRYVVAKAMREALSRPDQIEEYLGCECSEQEISELKRAIALQMKSKSDVALKLVQDALIEDDRIRDKCVELGKERYKSLFADDRELLAAIDAEISNAEKIVTDLKAEVASLESRRDSLASEVGDAERRLSDVTDNEQQVVQELERNIALKLGLQTVLKSARMSVGAVPSSALDVRLGSTVECENLDKNLVDLLIENLKRLGVNDASSPKGLQVATAGVVGCLATRMPIAMPEPLATPMATALAAALYAATPTRVIIPADFRDTAAVSKILVQPGVHVVEGAIDSANEGILFAMSRQWKSSTVIFSFRSYASALLLTKETWDSMFMPNISALTWLPFLSRGKKLAAARDEASICCPRRRDILDTAEELAGGLNGLDLPVSSLVLPAAVAVAADAACGAEEYEPVIAQHLALASGATSESFETLSDWCSNGAEKAWLDELRLRLGVPHE